MSSPLPPPPMPPVPPVAPLSNNTPLPNTNRKKNHGIPFPFLFPPINIIPPSCHPRLDSMIQLIHLDLHPRDQDTPKKSASKSLSLPWTAQQELEHGSQQCLQFYKIMMHYRAIHQTSLASNTKPNQTPKEESKKQPQITNAQLENAAKFNYQYCLGKTLCPQRLTALVQCWSQTQAATKEHGGIPALFEQGIMDAQTLCSKERKHVERCSGNLVQRYLLEKEGI